MLAKGHKPTHRNLTTLLTYEDKGGGTEVEGEF